jgi:DNA-binding transcriptional MerR regulator
MKTKEASKVEGGVFMTTLHAAKFLDLSVESVRRLERLGTLPAIKDSAGKRLFRTRDLYKFQDERLAESKREKKSRE